MNWNVIVGFIRLSNITVPLWTTCRLPLGRVSRSARQRSGARLSLKVDLLIPLQHPRYSEWHRRSAENQGKKREKRDKHLWFSISAWNEMVIPQHGMHSRFWNSATVDRCNRTNNDTSNTKVTVTLTFHRFYPVTLVGACFYCRLWPCWRSSILNFPGVRLLRATSITL